MGKRYFKVEVLVEVPEHHHKEWSERSDESFYLSRLLIPKEDSGVHIVAHDDITKRHYEARKYDVFDKWGGV